MDLEYFSLELNANLTDQNFSDSIDDLKLEMWPGSMRFPPIGYKPLPKPNPPKYPKPYPGKK